jgi:hypothetical protein
MSVPKMFTVRQKTARKNICAWLLHSSEKNGDAFMPWIVAGDETWVHDNDQLTKRQSVERHDQPSPRKKNFKVQTSAGKVMAGVFWESEGMLLVEFLERGVTINSRAICADIKAVKTRNWKGSAKREDESSPPPAWRRQTAHRSSHKGGNCKNGVGCSPSFSLQSRFSVLRLPPF